MRHCKSHLSFARVVAAAALFCFEAATAAPTGQLWVAAGGSASGNPDGQSDFRVQRVNSDGAHSVIAQVVPAAGAFREVGLDTANGLLFSLDADATLYTATLTGSVLQTQTAYVNGVDMLNSFAVDARRAFLYADLYGGDHGIVDAGHDHPHGGSLIRMHYSATGSIVSPYDPTQNGGNGAITSPSDVLLNSDSSNDAYANGRSLVLSHDGSTLYYVDDNDADSLGRWGFATNGIFKVSTSGSVGGGDAPMPTLLSSQTQFPLDLSNGRLTALAVDEARGLIYFITNDDAPAAAGGSHPEHNAIWSMPLAGGDATRLTPPAGIVLTYPQPDGRSLVLDGVAQQLYLADAGDGANHRAHIIQLNIATDGLSFTGGSNDFAPIDPDQGVSSDGYAPHSLLFDAIPVLSFTPRTFPLLEQSPLEYDRNTLLIENVAIADQDASQISGASVVMSGGFANSGDEFYVWDNGDHRTTGRFGNTNISVSLTNAAGNWVLTLSGVDTADNYTTALGQVEYFPWGDNPTNFGANTTRSFAWSVTDGTPDIRPGAQNSATSSVQVLPLDDGPVVTNFGSVDYVEHQSTAALIAPNLTLADVDSLFMAKAIVRGVDGGTLSFIDQNGITGSFDSVTTTLTLSGIATIADYEAALRSVAFSKQGIYFPSQSVFSFDVFDEGGCDGYAFAVINLIPVDDPPVIANAQSVFYAEGQSLATTIDSSLQLTDADDDALQGATIAISDGFQPGDLLGFANQNGISGSYDPNTGELTLSGTAALWAYQTALSSITFSSNNHNLTAFDHATSRTIRLVVHNALDSAPLFVSVTVQGSNDAPVNFMPASLRVLVDSSATIANLSIYDVDANPAVDLVTVTLTVTHGTLMIGGAGTEGIVGSGTSSVVLNGTQDALKSLLAAPGAITYVPDAGYVGFDALTMVTNDNGHSGTDGAKQAQDNMPIAVLASADSIFAATFE